MITVRIPGIVPQGHKVEGSAQASGETGLSDQSHEYSWCLVVCCYGCGGLVVCSVKDHRYAPQHRPRTRGRITSQPHCDRGEAKLEAR